MKEQIKYGIFFDDDYDYLQHLKKPEMVVMEPVIAPGQGDDDQGTVSTVVCVCVCVYVRACALYLYSNSKFNNPSFYTKIWYDQGSA